MTGSSKPATTTVTQQASNEPWKGAQPALGTAMGAAMNVFGQGAPEYFPGQTVAPFSAQTLAGMNSIQSNAQTTAPWAQTAAGGVNRIINQNPTQGTLNLSGMARGQQQNPFMMGTAMAGAATNPGTAGLNPWASGQTGANPFLGLVGATASGKAAGTGTDALNLTASGGLLQNPFLDAAVGRATNRVQNDVASIFAKGGRYGSTAHQDVLQQGVGDVASQMYGQAYDQDQSRRLGAASQLAGYEVGDIDRQFQGANAIAGLGESAIGRQYDATGLLAGYGEQGLNRALQGFGLAGDMFNSGQTNSLNAFNSLSTDAARGADSTLSAIGAMPGVYDFANTGARDLMGVGSMLEGFDQAQIDADKARWDYGQNAERANIEWLNAIATGQGQLGGSSYGTQQVPYQRSNPFLQTLGAAGGLASGLGALGKAGGLAAIFGSDRRLKTDIVPIGRTKGGTPTYSYRYAWDAPNVRRIGVMADEAPPEAVIKGAMFGFDMVDYAKVA